MRPTVHDIAAKAGVSLATVDRVLNDRMQDLKDSITATLEYHRTGAVKGVIATAGLALEPLAVDGVCAAASATAEGSSNVFAIF